MNTFHVEDYQSDEEETDIEMQDNVETKKKENKSKDWVKFATYINEEEAIKALSFGTLWGRTYQNRTFEGRKVYYRCKKVKKRNKKQCSAELY
jgi:hypothetical protein